MYNSTTNASQKGFKMFFKTKLPFYIVKLS
jgi:hypothetical protein